MPFHQGREGTYDTHTRDLDRAISTHVMSKARKIFTQFGRIQGFAELCRPKSDRNALAPPSWYSSTSSHRRGRVR